MALDTVLNSVLERSRKKLIMASLKSNAFMAWAFASKRVETEDGGYNITNPLTVGRNPNVSSYSYYDELPVAQTDEFDTVEILLKGVEIPLPDGVGPFYDKDDNSRNEIRIQWWKSAKGKTYKEMLFPQGNSKGFGGQLIPSTDAELLPVYEDNVPLLFGHYWLDSTNSNPPQVQTEQICCLDYSVAKKGFLAAYRWEGEKILKNDRFVWV